MGIKNCFTLPLRTLFDEIHGVLGSSSIAESASSLDFRRSAVRNMIRRGVPQVVAMRISGHKTMTAFNRYNIVDETDLADAAKKIESGRENSLSTAQVAAPVAGNPKVEPQLVN